MTSGLDRFAVESLRETLLDDERFLKLADFFIGKMKAELLAEAPSGGFNEFFGEALAALTAENRQEIAERSESPIEKLFLNSLVLCSIKSQQLLSVHATYTDCAAEIAQLRSDLAHFRELETWFAANKPNKTLDEFLDTECARGKMLEDERRYLHRLVFKYRYLPMSGLFHMSIQPKFPAIRIDGRSIRPDIYFWIPDRPNIKIIVECDGYQYHSSKERFTLDRQRDRKLSALGYDVLRFSGQEIHRDPPTVAGELAARLDKIAGGE
ncbi:endonuclease domain-containing protein [Bradyrhizobium sp. ma5]|uniref:endonuclease domain-containing protein n=1 Tax=Bradyrhizobium sp. ma5 TaxID=3344828 RepID=UPI0035D41949